MRQNPLGESVGPGEVGDIVRVSDSTSTIYLTPAEYDRATDTELRSLLAKGC